MSDLFKTTELTYDELLYAYEQIGKDHQKETQENAKLRSDIKHYVSEIETLERRIQYIKKQVNR